MSEGCIRMLWRVERKGKERGEGGGGGVRVVV